MTEVERSSRLYMELECGDLFYFTLNRGGEVLRAQACRKNVTLASSLTDFSQCWFANRSCVQPTICSPQRRRGGWLNSVYHGQCWPQIAASTDISSGVCLFIGNLDGNGNRGLGDSWWSCTHVEVKCSQGVSGWAGPAIYRHNASLQAMSAQKQAYLFSKAFSSKDGGLKRLRCVGKMYFNRKLLWNFCCYRCYIIQRFLITGVKWPSRVWGINNHFFFSFHPRHAIIHEMFYKPIS